MLQNYNSDCFTTGEERWNNADKKMEFCSFFAAIEKCAERIILSGRDQLSEYHETHNLSDGYLVTFSFLKEKVVQEKPEWIEHNGKKIYEAVI